MSSHLAWVILGCTLALNPGTATAQGCPELVGRYPDGISRVIAADGSTAYLANGASLTVVDLSVPASPSVLGSVELPYSIRHLAHDGNRVYAMTRVHLHVIDVGTVDPPVEIGRLEFDGYHLDADGDLLCVQTDDDLRVFDVSSPTAPTMVGKWSGGGWDLKVVGEYAYISNGGLQILDLSDPTSPTQIGQIDYLAIQSIDVVEDTVFGVGAKGLHVFDVSDPSAPIQLGILASMWGSDVVVDGDRAYLTDGHQGLHVVDVSDPAMPQLAGTAPKPAGEDWSGVAAIADHGLVSAGQHGLRVIDATDPSTPLVAAGLNTPGTIKHMAHSDGVLYVAASARGLRTVNVSDPLVPKEITFLDLGGAVEAVDVKGDLAVAVGQVFKVIDISDPSSPAIVGEIPGITGGRGVELVDGLAYVVNGETGLQIFDISTPNAPIEIGSLDPGGSQWWRQVVVSGEHVFMPRSGVVEVISVEDPTHPVSVTSIPDPAYTVATYKSSLLVGSSLGLRIFDIQYPSYPVEIAQYPTTGSVLKIGISGSVAYLGIQLPGEYNTYVEVVDIGDPSSPVAMGHHIAAGFPAPGFVFDQQMAYFFKSNSGFDTFALCQGPLFADGFESGNTTAWVSVTR